MDGITHAEHLEHTKRRVAQGSQYVTALTAGMVELDSFRFVQECAEYVVRAAADRVRTVFPDDEYDIGVRFAVWEKDQPKKVLIQVIDEAIQLAEQN